MVRFPRGPAAKDRRRAVFGGARVTLYDSKLAQINSCKLRPERDFYCISSDFQRSSRSQKILYFSSGNWGGVGSKNPLIISVQLCLTSNYTLV